MPAKIIAPVSFGVRDARVNVQMFGNLGVLPFNETGQPTFTDPHAPPNAGQGYLFQKQFADKVALGIANIFFNAANRKLAFAIRTFATRFVMIRKTIFYRFGAIARRAGNTHFDIFFVTLQR